MLYPAASWADAFGASAKKQTPDYYCLLPPFAHMFIYLAKIVDSRARGRGEVRSATFRESFEKSYI